MPHNITGSNVFTDPVPALADGDAVAQASSDPTTQALANRDVNLNTRLATIEGENLNTRVTALEKDLVAWGCVQTDGAGGFTFTKLSGCTASIGVNGVHIVLTTNQADTHYPVLVTGPVNGGQGWNSLAGNKTSGAGSSFDLQTYDKTDALVNISAVSVVYNFHVIGS